MYPSLPTPKKSLIFYSNQHHQDFRLTLIRAIEKAQKNIHIIIYAITDTKLIEKLHQKALQGITVTVIVDPKAGSLPLPAPIICRAEKGRGLMHRKIVVIDESLVFLGSANLTPSSLLFHDNLSLGFYHPQLAHFLTEQNTGTFTSPNFELLLLPHPGALPKLLSHIESAQTSITCAMFTLTHPELALALIRAHKRGVDVKVFLDYYASRGAGKKAAEQLKTAGIPIRQSQGMQLMHHKWALIDEKTLILGSTNWTKAAFTKNRDCLLFLENLGYREKKYVSHLEHLLQLEGRS
ncbi:MAG: hypothetical protein JSR58_06525 [Verrucomicrobia bacterium]|nr:hypothetical protein [Verrucomicrobiota bacterium]